MSGSDDMTVKVWDERAKNFIASYESNYQITAVAFNATSEYVFFGGLDNSIKAINLKKNQVEFCLLGHLDTITGIKLSNSGKYLLSNAMDNTVK